MTDSCTGVILAGGQNKRFNGINKAFLDIQGKRIIDHLYDTLSSIFKNLIIVTNQPQDYLDFDARIVTDIFSQASALSGLHTGLFFSSTPFMFATACDTPFIRPELINTLIDAIEPKKDIVIPKTPQGVEPLCAIYSKNCLNHMERQLVQSRLKIKLFFDKVRVKYIDEALLKQKDPEWMSFFNINNPEQLDKAKKLLGG